jgi:hypothetical protein
MDRLAKEVCGHADLVFGGDDTHWMVIWKSGDDCSLVNSRMPREELVTMLERALVKVQTAEPLWIE